MKLNVKRFLFFIGLTLGILGILLFRFPVQFQSSLNDLFSVKIQDKPLPEEVMAKYTNVLNVMVGSDSFETAKKKSDDLYRKLKSAGIQDITYQVPQNLFDQGLAHLKTYQNSFLSPNMYRLLLNSETTRVREKAVNVIQSSWIPPVVSLKNDPFLLMTDYVQNMPKPVSSWSEREGVLWQEKNGQNYILMFVQVNPQDTYELLRQVHLVQNLSSSNTNCRIHLSGAPVHTAQMFEKTKKDISLISVLAIFVLIVLTYILFNRFQAVLLVAFNLMIAFICGIINVFLLSPQVHFLTFAFGASLVGICVDYSFHRFYCSTKKDYNVLSKNMLYSYLTTVGCFVPLLFSDFPLLYQIALFTTGGLTGTFLWIFISPVPEIEETLSSFQLFRIPFKKLFFVCLIFVSTLGLLRIHFDHSPRNLYNPAVSLQQEETFFHQLNGENFSYLLLIYGKDLQSVLEKEERIKEKEDFFSLSTLLPSLKKQKEHIELIQNLYHQELKKIQSELGLKQNFFFKQTPLIDEKNFREQFDLLFQQYVIKTPDAVWSVTPLKQSLEISDKDVLIFEPAKYLSTQLGLYTYKSYKNLLISFCFLFLILCIIYRQKAFKYLFPSLVGCLGTLGILSLCGQGITFFHLLSLFVVIGLSMDYTIFLFSSHNTYKPVLFSFFSSFIGFGLLSFIHFRMVAIMGQTIAFGLFLSFLITLLMKKD